MAPNVSELSHQIQHEIALADDEKQPDVARIENNPSLAKAIFHDAKAATTAEHEATPWDGFKMHPKAVAWSALVSMAVVMDGYDETLMKALFAEKAFQKHFGNPVKAGAKPAKPGGKPSKKPGYQLTAPWQAGISNAATIGIIIGMCLNGYVREKVGMKRTMLTSCVVLSGFVFILFFATSPAMLLAGELLCGICWGIFHATAPIYASEVCPTVLRGYLTTFINLSAVLGHLISAGVLRGCQLMTTKWAYKIPFSLQWIWPVLLFVGILLCPESPWWLVRKGRIEDAERSLKRLTNGDGTEQTVAMMLRTTQEEKQVGGETSYWDCFKGQNLHRTEIAFGVWSIQVFSGLPFQSYNTYFFEQAGLSNTKAFSLSIGNYSMGAAGTLLSWILITWFGRRTIFMGGLCVMFILLLIIGFCAIAPPSNDNAIWAQAILLLCWTFAYDSSVGPVAWAVASEVSATSLRAQTIAVGRTGSYIVNIVFNVATPYMLNPTAANWKGKTAFLFAGTCALSLLWAFFRLPELKGRTYEEINLLFWKRVPARKFASTHVDAYEEEQYVDPTVQQLSSKQV